MAKEVCLVVGAGCTVADVTSRPKKEQPPLDKGFFQLLEGRTVGR